MEHQTLFLVRGLPGSGKSTLAAALCGYGPFYHAEADQYFVTDGEYRFDASRLTAAHMDCIRRVREAVAAGSYRRVVVSNTFTMLWEMEPYIRIAMQAGWRYSVIHMETAHGSIHGIPEETMAKMAARWERFVPPV